MKTRLSRALTAVLVSGGIGLTGLGLATGTANAEPFHHGPPTYHWCPGDFWNPEWGFNWEWLVCHDDWQRDGYGPPHGGGYEGNGFGGGHGYRGY